MSEPGTSLDRETWISLLDSATKRPGDELNEEWLWLLDQLGMEPDDYPAIMEALHQGRWRKADDPKAYLAYVARKEARKDQLATLKRDNLVLLPTTDESEGASLEGTLDYIAHLRETAEAVQGSDGVWRRGGGAERTYFEEFDEDENGKPLSLRGRLIAKVPNTLMVVRNPSAELEEVVEELNASNDEWHIHLQPQIGFDFSKWAKLAGFDKWEMQVLNYRREGLSREKALAEQLDELSRKALQAAWKRYDRTGNQRLREFAEKEQAEMSRNDPRRTLDK